MADQERVVEIVSSYGILCRVEGQEVVATITSPEQRKDLKLAGYEVQQMGMNKFMIRIERGLGSD